MDKARDPIIVRTTNLPGVRIIQRRPIFEDHRGVYGEIYNKKEYIEKAIGLKFEKSEEDDFSCSRRNVLRGLHGDTKTWKLITCLYGEIFLVVLNYDETSKYFGKHLSFTLTQKSPVQILIPPKYANGHLVLSDEAVFHYKQSEYYRCASDQFVVRWDDPRFKIKWPLIGQPILSERDSK